MQKNSLLILIAMISVQFTAAQTTISDDVADKKNIFKLNLTAPVLKNYAVQYERVLSKTVSVVISGRIMPASTLPFKEEIRKNVIKGDDDLITDAFNQAKFSNFAITPEVRFYLGKKGYGRGFYVAPYYRFARYKVHELNYVYNDGSDDVNIKLTGDLTAHTGGFLLGAQWMLSNTVGLDWWIAGPNMGKGKGNLAGLSDKAIDPDVQQNIRESLENDLDIPFTRTTVTVDSKGANIKMDGPWAGIRAGLLLTFRF
ncbi:MAG TPA: DUF3575 domain-containing protein [Niabella sp.]|nr:DUF3575 domain-containing protein [Niabella sp.]